MVGTQYFWETGGLLLAYFQNLLKYTFANTYRVNGELVVSWDQLQRRGMLWPADKTELLEIKYDESCRWSSTATPGGRHRQQQQLDWSYRAPRDHHLQRACTRAGRAAAERAGARVQRPDRGGAGLGGWVTVSHGELELRDKRKHNCDPL